MWKVNKTSFFNAKLHPKNTTFFAKIKEKKFQNLFVFILKYYLINQEIFQVTWPSRITPQVPLVIQQTTLTPIWDINWEITRLRYCNSVNFRNSFKILNRSKLQKYKETYEEHLFEYCLNIEAKKVTLFL